jgi:DNA polymerase-3 subunit delta
MLIFVYGDDNFRVRKKVHQMIDAFKEKYDPTGMNTSVYPQEGAKKCELGEVMGSVRALPFLGEKRMVVVRDLVGDLTKAAMKPWEEGFKSVPESTIVVFWETLEPKALEKKPLYKALSDEAKVHAYPFPQLQGRALQQWAQQRAGELNGKLNLQAVNELVNRVGPDLWQMHNEVEKLVAYANGQEVTKEMVEELVQASFEGKIFDLIDAISKRQPAKALKLLQEERWSGASDHYLLTMLGRQVRILLGARALLDQNLRASKQELASVMGVHPFVAQKALAQAKGFDIETLKATHELLYQFDRQMKTGQINAEMAVDLTAVKLMQ